MARPDARTGKRPVPPKGGSGAERDTREAVDRSRGGYGTKACVIADGRGRAVAFRQAPGQAHELPHAVPLLDQLPGVPKWGVGDRGYTSHAFRKHIGDMGAPRDPASAPRGPRRLPGLDLQQPHSGRAPPGEAQGVACHRNPLRETDASFMGVLALAAACDWLKR